MTASLRALVSGLIDDAGLFPPARLPLEQAAARHLDWKRGSDAFLVTRFVAPAARLDELATEFERRGGRASVAALARGGESLDALVAGLEHDLGDIERCHKRADGAVAVEAVEIKLPASLSGTSAEAPLGEMLDRVLAAIAARGAAPVDLFFEGALGPDWHRALNATVAALAEPRATAHKSVRRVGLKLRCGGTEPGAFPPVEQVARAIALCRDLRVPFKATAGLHDPVRHLDRALMVKVHGFLNVFGAAVLAHACGLEEATIAEAVADEDERAFTFEPERMRWREYDVPLAAITAARAEFATSVGSCSLEEPRDGLARLGLL